MDVAPPHNNNSRELLQRSIEAGLQFVPGIGGALAVTFVTAVTWRLNQKREEWLEDLATGVEELRQRLADVDLDTLVSDPRFSDAVVLAARMVEHTSQAEKLDALRNAVLNSVGPDAPDADTQAIFMNLVDRFTPSHLRLLALWDNPRSWFASHDIPELQAGFASSRTVTVEVGLPEMAGRQQFYVLVWSEIKAAGLTIGADLGGLVSPTSLMDKLTSDLGSQFLKFISSPS
jgi:hypothetical protein